MITQKCISCDKDTKFEQFSAFPRLCENCETNAAEIIAKLKDDLASVTASLPNALTRHPDCGDPGCCDANPE